LKICNISSLAFIVFATIFQFGCTTEADIKRDQMIKNLSIQMTQNQQLNQETSSSLDELKTHLGTLSGQVEEREQQITMSQAEKTKRLQENVALLQSKVEEQSKQISSMEEQLTTQKEYLDKLLKTLQELTGKAAYSNLSPYDQAMKDYKASKYKSAWPKMLALLDDKTLGAKQKATVYHNLGMISYHQKRYKDAQTYFSKLLTDFPKSSNNPNALLYLARSFSKLNDKVQAKQAYEMLIQSYPTSKTAATAKKDLESLQ